MNKYKSNQETREKNNQEIKKLYNQLTPELPEQEARKILNKIESLKTINKKLVKIIADEQAASRKINLFKNDLILFSE